MSPQDRILTRAAGLLARDGATLREAAPGLYALRTGPDLRRRPAMTLDEIGRALGGISREAVRPWQHGGGAP